MRDVVKRTTVASHLCNRSSTLSGQETALTRSLDSGNPRNQLPRSEIPYELRDQRDPKRLSPPKLEARHADRDRQQSTVLFANIRKN